MTWLKSLLAPKSRIFFTDDPELLGDCRELAALWTACLKQPCYSDHQKCEQAIRHSFTVQLAFSEESHEDPEQPVTLTLVAAARTISDGYFAAQLVDVCVREDFRELGIGGQLVDKLSAQTRALGPQTMAVFAGPEHRLFFWKCGFRWDHRYGSLTRLLPCTAPEHAACLHRALCLLSLLCIAPKELRLTRARHSGQGASATSYQYAAGGPSQAACMPTHSVAASRCPAGNLSSD